MDAIAWLVARIRQVARIRRTLKVYLCTIFLLRMMFAKNGRHLFADTERILSLRRRLACVLFTLRRAVLNRGPLSSRGRVQTFRSLRDFSSRGQFQQGTRWLPILLPKVHASEERSVHCCILLLFSNSHARFHSLKYIDSNELFVAKTCHLKDSVYKLTRIINDRKRFVTL